MKAKKVCSDVKKARNLIEDTSPVESTSELDKAARIGDGNSSKNSSQIDLTRDEDEEDGVEEVEGKRKQEVGKNLKFKGRNKEVRNEHEYSGMTVQEMRDHAIMLLDDAETD